MKRLQKLIKITGALCLGPFLPCFLLSAQSIESSAKLLPEIQASMAEVEFGHLVPQITGRAVVKYDEEDA